LQLFQMKNLPLFKFTGRARATSWAIAFCTMFIVSGFSIVSGLGKSMDNLVDNFSSEYALITSSDESSLGQHTAQEFSGIANITAFCTWAQPVLESTGEIVSVFSITDPFQILPEDYSVQSGTVLVGSALPLSGSITLVGSEAVTVQVSGRFSSTMFSPYWIMGTSDLLRSLLGAETDAFNFAIAKGLSDAQVDDLLDDGFSVQELIGIVEFLESGTNEIESDARWILIPSAFAVAVLAYGFIGSETADRRHDIGILKTLGAGRSRILGYLLADGLLISSWGAVLGVALGIMLAYAVTTFASAAFTSVFILEIEEWNMLLSFLATVGAGSLGALIPALRMSFTSPVEDLKEVAQFS